MPVKIHSPSLPEEQPAAFSSPPCYAHEVDPAYLGLVPVIDLNKLRKQKSTLDISIAALRSLRLP